MVFHYSVEPYLLSGARIAQGAGPVAWALRARLSKLPILGRPEAELGR
jgi:hypothetical protein